MNEIKKFRSIAVTYENLGEYASQEILSLNGSKSDIKGPVLLFDSANPSEIADIAYSSQSFSSVGFLLAEYSLKEISSLKNKSLPEELMLFLEDGMSFSVRCRTEEEDIDKTDIEITFSSMLHDFFSSRGKKINVNLSHPDLNFIVFIHKKNVFFFLDFAGFALDKRDYKIFTNRLDIKGNLAFLFLNFSGYSPKKSLMDPFCKSATICIEAALFSSKVSPNFFRKDKFSFLRFPNFRELNQDDAFLEKKHRKEDSSAKEIFAFDPLLKNINAARKNAKIAEVQKSISFARINLEDIDLKFSKDIDLICSFPPQINKFNEKEISAVYRELFHQADLVLKDKGRMALMSLKKDALIKISEESGFCIEDEKLTMAGKQEIFMFIFSRKRKA